MVLVWGANINAWAKNTVMNTVKTTQHKMYREKDKVGELRVMGAPRGR